MINEIIHSYRIKKKNCFNLWFKIRCCAQTLASWRVFCSRI